jgi:hypothetical protein
MFAEGADSKISLRTLGAFTLVGAVCALGFAWLLRGWGFPMLLTVPFHEFGHSFVAWLTGRFSIPVGAFIPMAAFATVSAESSWVAHGIWIAAWAAAVWWGHRGHSKFVFQLACAVILVSLVFFHRMSAESASLWFFYGGIAGEFVLPGLVVMSVFYAWPGGRRWDFLKVPLLSIALISLSLSTVRWWQIERDWGLLPLGTFLGGSGDASGDVDRLISSQYWGPKELIASYIRLSIFAWGVIAGHGIWAVLLGRRNA